MDAAGKNRYELLFMDDDGEAPPSLPKETTAVIKKKQPVTAAAGTPAGAGTKKPVANKKSTAEKENKSAALNKNDAGNKKAPSSDGAVQKPRQGGERPSAGGPGGNRPRYNNNNNNNSGSGSGNNNNTNNQNNNNNGNGNDNNRSVTFRNQNNEAREQRNNRRNFRENTGGAESGMNDQRSTRQFNREFNRDRENRDRDNRGPPRKREFDRQSGSDKTGVKSVDKRDGAGAHNWGSVKQEIDDINKSTTTTANAADADATLTDKEESANDQSTDQVPATEEEEEAKEMTLDEYKALKQQRAKPQYNLRKAGEGEDTAQWKKMTVLNKKKEGDSEEELEYDPSLYPQRVGRLQRIVDIQFKFNDERRGGFGRGRGRGPRPGGDRGGERFDRGAERGERFDRGGDRGERGDRGGERGERFDRGGERGERFDRGGERGERNDRDRENRGGRYEDGGRPQFNRGPRNFGDRPPRNAASHVPKVDDERQFPTLG